MALPHAEAELLAMASACTTNNARDVRGWHLDDWTLDDGDVSRAVAAYTALLRADTDPDADRILLLAGVTLDDLLLDPGGAKPTITRADVVELMAAASAVAQDGWPADAIHMPNVPKPARGKSDSGVDAMSVRLQQDTALDLGPGEVLFLASVKHTVQASTSDLRYKLVASVGPVELSAAYMAGQLKVLNADLVRAGVPRPQARRVFHFIRDWPDPDHVRILAVAGVSPGAAADLDRQLTEHLPEVEPGLFSVRALLIPGLPTLHELCP